MEEKFIEEIVIPLNGCTGNGTTGTTGTSGSSGDKTNGDPLKKIHKYHFKGKYPKPR